MANRTSSPFVSEGYTCSCSGIAQEQPIFRSNKRPERGSREAPVDLAFDPTLRDDGGDEGEADSQHAELFASTTMFAESSDLARAITAKEEADGALAPFAPGYLLAERYRIRERIGHGGFGFVYSADDLELEVIVAIKVLRPEVDRDEEVIRRFKQEIQLARQVTHQNVCRIFDVGFHSVGELRVPFLSMELLAGKSLAEYMREHGTLPLAELKLVTTQVAYALEAAHKAGIVHADLKPANIMLVGEGMATRAVVTDFGLASAHTSDELRKKGGIVGTPAYMAPEQVEGKALTPAADFYALGCTLYHLISRTLPFEEPSALATAKARLHRAPPSLKAAASDAPLVWVSLVRDLMAVDPKDRLADAASVRRRLRPRRRPWIFVGIALLLAIVLGTFLMPREPSYGPFTLSLPPAGPALERYQEGLSHWDAMRPREAAAIWQKAIDEGFAHARTYDFLCDARETLSLVGQSGACREDAYKAARGLPREDRDYYEALYRRQQHESVEATKLILRLLNRHPGDLQLSQVLVGIQREQQEFGTALETLAKVRPRDAAETVMVQGDRVTLLTQGKNYSEAIDEGTGALASARKLGMVSEQFVILESLAQSHRNLGNLQASEAYGEESLRLAQTVESPRHEAAAISLLIAIAIAQERYARAVELVEKRTTYLHDAGNLRAASEILITKAEIWLVTGKPVEAEKLLSEQALPQLRKDNNSYWEGYALIARSEARTSLGKSAEAIEDCYAGDAVFRGIRSTRLQAFANMVCGVALIDAGRLAEAEERLREARKLRTDLKLNVQLIENTVAEAELSLAKGESKAAYEGASDAARRYAELDRKGKARAAQELMGRAALVEGDMDRAIEALRAARALEGAENIEAELRLSLLEARIANVRDHDEAAVEALGALANEAEARGYGRIAHEARLELDNIPRSVVP